jgi:hypothetical protein
MAIKIEKTRAKEVKFGIEADRKQQTLAARGRLCYTVGQMPLKPFFGFYRRLEYGKKYLRWKYRAFLKSIGRKRVNNRNDIEFTTGLHAFDERRLRIYFTYSCGFMLLLARAGEWYFFYLMMSSLILSAMRQSD